MNCRVYRTRRSGKLTLNTYRRPSRLRAGEELGDQNLILTNTMRSDCNAPDGTGEKNSGEEVRKGRKGGDRIRVGSMLDVKVDLSAADDEIIKVTAL